MTVLIKTIQIGALVKVKNAQNLRKKAVVMLKRRYKRQKEGRFGLLSAARLVGA